MLSKTIIITLISSLAYASPFKTSNFTPQSRRSAAAASAADIILKIAPTSNTCAGAAFPAECETSAQAAPFLISAFSQYAIYNIHEMASVLALVAFESGDFKYNTNHFPAPGRPGQGTRNLQTASFNLMYAQSIPALKDKVAAITTATTVAGLSDDKLNAIRALVLPDEYSWASGAWFLTSQCASQRTAIQAGGDAGFAAYMGCVGTPVTDDRKAYFTRAVAAFGS